MVDKGSLPFLWSDACFGRRSWSVMIGVDHQRWRLSIAIGANSEALRSASITNGRLSVAIGIDRQRWRLSIAIGVDRQWRRLGVAMVPTTERRARLATRQARSAVMAEIRWSDCEVLSEGKRESGKGRKIKWKKKGGGGAEVFYVLNF